ncbi:hypothetical protein MTR67_034310, partial [Solanum verrucosum]
MITIFMLYAKRNREKEVIAFISSPDFYIPYSHFGFALILGYIVAEGRPIREHRLPCCGMGIGWFLFIIGFFLGAIPWYIGAFLLLCARLDYREKPRFIACTLAVSLFISCNINSFILFYFIFDLATLALVAVTLGVTK